MITAGRFSRRNREAQAMVFGGSATRCGLPLSQSSILTCRPSTPPLALASRTARLDPRVDTEAMSAAGPLVTVMTPMTESPPVDDEEDGDEPPPQAASVAVTAARPAAMVRRGLIDVVLPSCRCACSA